MYIQIVKNLYKSFQKNPFKIIFGKIEINLNNEKNEIYLRPAPFWFQLKYFFKKDLPLDKNSRPLFIEIFQNNPKFILSNCKFIINSKNRTIKFQENNIFIQLYYFLSFGYLRQDILLEDEINILHKIFKKEYK